MFPAARLGDMTVTGDAITGPGVPTVFIGNMPASVLGDVVSGAACAGAITLGSMTVTIGGRPAARVTSQVTGVNPATGVPVTTAVAPPCCPTVFIGDVGGGGAGGGGAAAAGGQASSLAQSRESASVDAALVETALAASQNGSTPVDEPLDQAPEEPKSTFTLQVVMDETGAGVPGVELKITLPDGEQETQMTDRNGMVRIDELASPGVCSVTCDMTDPELPRTCDFVGKGKVRLTPPESEDDPARGPQGRNGQAADGVGEQEEDQTSAAGSSQVKSRPSSSVEAGDDQARKPRPWGHRRLIAKIEQHKVKTGESLAGLARANGMTWQELTKFNWGTDVPRKINEHLERDVGCTRKTRDGQNYVFDDSDDPGLVYIPSSWVESGLATDAEHVIRVRMLEPKQLHTVFVDLEIDPEGIAAQDDKYTLFCSDNRSVYEKTRTVRDDHIEGDEFLTLKFSGLVPGHRYTLEVDPGADGERYTVFEDVPLEDLLFSEFFYESVDWEPEESQEEPMAGEDELPYDDDDSEAVTEDSEISDDDLTDEDDEDALDQEGPSAPFN
jgi:uncharacterized Zn-binding protein involved in type VI secretion